VCPTCRPKLASPKTLFETRLDLLGVSAVTLGWLVPLRSPDAQQRGKLISLSRPRVTLTRGTATDAPQTHPDLIALADNYLSAGHATIQRPKGSASQEPFVLRDRQDPGPSSNGTFLNGRKLEPAEAAQLADGDMIRVGTTELLFRSLWLPPGAVNG
jgi:pSer/pThr/pTyr-binding forkhead associated (FHA) protein